MKQVELVWVSNSPDWEDVHGRSDQVNYQDGKVRIVYSGATDDNGHYEGHFELSLSQGMQAIEGEYTVFPPRNAAEHFNQVVSFGLTGQIKTDAQGRHYFAGIWDEGGIAQEFKVGPLQLAGEASDGAGDAALDEAVFRVDLLDASALPPELVQQVQALREFELASAPLMQTVAGVTAFADFERLFTNLAALMQAVKLRLDACLAGQDSAEAVVTYLRDEASLQLEQLLDQGAAANLPPAPPELAAFMADIEALAENLQVAVMREGYTLCKVWLGLVDE
ncbi:hypothetical protein [Chitinimonas sp.]|uniref:hypothetical protein n=1 Tax=Chitinimonas sp. TaxID=1934313 RepID=UPI002F93B4D6